MTAEDLRLLELIVLRARDKSPRSTEYNVLNTLAEQLRDYAQYLEAREAKLAAIHSAPFEYEDPNA